MKKIFLVLIACTMLVTLASCGNHQARTNSKEITPLTLNSVSYDKVCRGFVVVSDTIETNQGVNFYISSGYLFKSTQFSDIFSFGKNWTIKSLEQNGFYMSQEDKEKEYDYNFEISSNAKIKKIGFYDDDRNLIGSRKCKNNVVEITEKYQYERFNSFVLYVQYKGLSYKATFQHACK